MKKKRILIVGLTLFILGYILSFAFSSVAVWSDLEGMSFWGNPEVVNYDPTIDGNFRISQLDCPIILTRSEQAEVRISVRNVKKIDTTEILQTNISVPAEDQGLMRNYSPITLDTKKMGLVSFKIGPENVTNRNYIFIRSYLLTKEGQPPYETNHCGIKIVNIPNLTGNQIVIGTLVLSSILMILGIFLWHTGSSREMRRFNKTRNLLIAMATLIMISGITNFSGVWLLSAIILVLSLLLVLSVVESTLLRSVE